MSDSIPVLAPLPAGAHSHVVQFYKDDRILLEGLTDLVSTALENGRSAVVIATRTHGVGLSHRLKARGYDLTRAFANGSYVPMDASETLSKFMIDGMPDASRFFKAMGKVLNRAAAAAHGPDHPVVAFGEMVAVLWAEGKTEAALRLEVLWNDLRQTHAFSLLCAYPAQMFHANQQLNALLRVCSTHSRVIRHEGYAEPSESAIFMTDAAGVVTTWGTQAARVNGYSASEMIGRHFSCLYPADRIKSGQPQRLLDLANRDDKVEDEGPSVRKDGSLFWAAVTVSAIRDDAGTLVGFLNRTRDLTGHIIQ